MLRALFSWSGSEARSSRLQGRGVWRWGMEAAEARGLQCNRNTAQHGACAWHVVLWLVQTCSRSFQRPPAGSQHCSLQGQQAHLPRSSTPMALRKATSWSASISPCRDSGAEQANMSASHAQQLSPKGQPCCSRHLPAWKSFTQGTNGKHQSAYLREARQRPAHRLLQLRQLYRDGRVVAAG